MQRIRVPVSKGEEFYFEGREVEVSEGMRDSMDPNYKFAYIFRLYECPDGYRVHETIEALSPRAENDYALHPVVGYLGYGTYTKEEVQEQWGGTFEYLKSD